MSQWVTVRSCTDEWRKPAMWKWSAQWYIHIRRGYPVTMVGPKMHVQFCALDSPMCEESLLTFFFLVFFSSTSIRFTSPPPVEEGTLRRRVAWASIFIPDTATGLSDAMMQSTSLQFGIVFPATPIVSPRRVWTRGRDQMAFWRSPDTRWMVLFANSRNFDCEFLESGLSKKLTRLSQIGEFRMCFTSRLAFPYGSRIEIKLSSGWTRVKLMFDANFQINRREQGGAWESLATAFSA